MAGEKPCDMMTSQSADDTLDTLAAVHGSDDDDDTPEDLLTGLVMDV